MRKIWVCACMIAGIALMSLGGCSKEVDSELPTEMSKEQIEDYVTKLDNLDKAMNIRYSGYASVDYLKEFSVPNESYIRNVFEDETKSINYDVTQVYNDTLKDLKSRVEMDGGTVDQDYNISYPELEASLPGLVVKEETPAIDILDPSNDGGDTGPDPLELIYGDAETNPMMTDIYDLNGVLLWSAKSQGEIDEMTEVDINRFADMYAANERAYVEHYQEVLRRKNEVQSNEEDEHDHFENGDKRYRFDINELRKATSEFVKYNEADNTYYIEWKYIIDNYNKDTGRLHYNVLGYDNFVDVTSETYKVSSLTYVGDSNYNFDRESYEIFEDGTFNVVYKAKGDKGYKLDVQGSFEGSLISLDSENIKKVVELYN